MGFRISIAATREDWIDLFFESNIIELLNFYPMSTNALEDVASLRIDEVPNLGVAEFGALVQENSYLVLPANEPPAPREIHLNSGGIRYAFDQLINPDSLIMTPGGLWKNNCYVVGEVSSLHNTGISVTVPKKIRSVLRKKYRYSDGYWVGPKCIDQYSYCKFDADCRS